jgi:hypothetical protein
MRHRNIGWIVLGIFLLLAGFGIGLGLSWGLFPVQIINTSPAALSPTEKDSYRLLVADDFHVNADLSRARSRLDLLEEENSVDSLEDQITRVSRSGDPQNILASLQALKDALIENGARTLSSGTKEESNNQSGDLPLIVTRTVLPITPETTPDLISISTSESPLIYNRRPLCSENMDLALVQVLVIDQSGQPANGIVILIKSEDTIQRLITGLDPEIGSGYVDFVLEPGRKYTLSIEGIPGISEKVESSECELQDGKKYLGGWLIEIHL